MDCVKCIELKESLGGTTEGYQVFYMTQAVGVLSNKVGTMHPLPALSSIKRCAVLSEWQGIILDFAV